MNSISDALPQILGKDIYIYLSKENPDWSKEPSDVDLVIHFENKKVSIPLSDKRNMLYLVSSLHHFISPKSIIVSWHAKDIFSYLKARTEITLELENIVYDLHIINSYFGFKEEKPSNLKSAIEILRKSFKDVNWSKFAEFYKKIYNPLLSQVLPEIETNCVIDNSKKICVYPTYVIEGQANGRLSTTSVNSFSYNPHSIGNNEKLSLRPRDYEEIFVYFDYKNMEVNILQWLSGDKDLASIIDSGMDLYKGIWKKITKQEPTENHRIICKNIFLPVVFGQGAKSLSKKIGISEKNASTLIDSLVRSFPVAFNWVESQSPDGNNMATDVFGRKRFFDEQKHYKIKNFCIQSPASMVCLRKLVCLQEALVEKANICFHVHDGYCVLCNKNDVNLVSEIGIKTLEQEDELFPGLKLKTTCNFGHNLNNLKTLKEEVLL